MHFVNWSYGCYQHLTKNIWQNRFQATYWSRNALLITAVCSLILKTTSKIKSAFKTAVVCCWPLVCLVEWTWRCCR